MSTPQETLDALKDIRELIKETDDAQRAMRAAQRSKSPSRLEDAWDEYEMALGRQRNAMLRHADALVHVVRNFIP
jgi:hypothetical protein